MSELITEQEIINASNEAYKIAGNNAYFGNGFSAGVRFALQRSHAPQMLEMLKRLTEHLEFEQGYNSAITEQAKQLIQQATTIK